MPLPAPFDRLRLPLIGSPLFIVSGPELVIAQCKAGIIGSFPALNARPQSQLDEWLHQITEELAAHNRAKPDRPAAPFAVNQIVHKTNDRLEQDVEPSAMPAVPDGIDLDLSLPGEASRSEAMPLEARPEVLDYAPTTMIDLDLTLPSDEGRAAGAPLRALPDVKPPRQP